MAESRTPIRLHAGRIDYIPSAQVVVRAALIKVRIT
jgi:hypothetical protein